MKKNLLSTYQNKKGDYYDCVIHLDGTIENIAILHHLKFIHNMNPLGITFNHFSYDYNSKSNIRKCLEVYDIDHIMFTPRLSIIKRIKTSFPGDFNSLVDQAVYSFLFMTAKRYNVQLCVTSMNTKSLLNCETNDDIITLENMITKLKIVDVDKLVN